MGDIGNHDRLSPLEGSVREMAREGVGFTRGNGNRHDFAVAPHEASRRARVVAYVENLGVMGMERFTRGLCKRSQELQRAALGIALQLLERDRRTHSRCRGGAPVLGGRG